MTANAAPLQLNVLATPEVIGDVRRAVARYAREWGVAEVFEVELAVSEVLTNAVLHAYIDRGAPGPVEVLAEMHAGDGVVVTISDHGSGIRPRPDSPGLGLGLPLVARLATSFEMQSPPEGGSRICMHFA
jgi:serine/threonine-protein kinase RsbW/stage II sporulation protein AB (anti-sigma F factor)